MFIENDGEIKVTLHIKKSARGTIRIETDLKAVKEEDRAKFEAIEFIMKPLTWKQYNDVQRAATVNRGPGVGVELDWVLYKERKLCAVLTGWDAKDKQGKPVPVTEANIFRLSPQIAETLLQEFDKATILGEEERKLLMEVHRYCLASSKGNTQAEAPPILVEIGLMERFHWTPMEIDQIPLGRLQRIFTAMEQRDRSHSEAMAVESQKNTKMKGKR